MLGHIGASLVFGSRLLLFYHLNIVDYKNIVVLDKLTRIMYGCETGFDINAGLVSLEYISFLKVAHVNSQFLL